MIYDSLTKKLYGLCLPVLILLDMMFDWIMSVVTYEAGNKYIEYKIKLWSLLKILEIVH